VLKKIAKGKKGSTIVLFTISITTLMAFSALFVDIGRVSLEKRIFQSAIDSAALAAAQDLPNTQKALQTVNDYMSLNSYTPDDIIVEFADSNYEIKITGTKQIEYTFAKVLDFDSTTIHQDAVAALVRMEGPFDYTLFSGSRVEELVINGGNLYVGGSSHTNQNFIGNGSNFTVTNNCEALGTINLTGTNISLGLRYPNAPYVSMPDYSDIIIKQAEQSGIVYMGSKTYNKSNVVINSAIYIDGNLTINGSSFSGCGTIIAKGNITFNGSGVYAGPDDSVSFYSMNGNITMNGSGTLVEGIVYAPKGTVRFNGSNQRVNGRAIGNEVLFNGNGISIHGSERELRSLPRGTVKLKRNK